MGNLTAATVLLRRADIDLRVRDFEGLTPLELYNTTVAGTGPSDEEASDGQADMFVWGGNRNYSLGLGHCNDCALPERARFSTPTRGAGSEPGARFARQRVRDVAMSRWHTVVLTTEPRANVYVCGIGNSGRLGRMPQTQPSLQPLRDFGETAVDVAAAPDHTLLVTASGAVYSFGANRMGQLGFVVEEGMGATASSSGTVRSASAPPAPPGTSVGSGGAELDIQLTPRRVLGPLKREIVLGAAASRHHSAVFTAEALYTWGTNTGQLGYDRQAAPVQVLPRKVTAISQPIRQVAATEFATACLLTTWDVVVFHGDTYFRVNFPMPRVSGDMGVFRPRQAQPKPSITKLTCSGTTFGALTELGDLFTFSLEHPGTLARGATPAGAAKHASPRPQLVWSVRRRFSGVRDVALGPDGTILLCTASGHVYLRSRRPDTGKAKPGGRAHKFHFVPFLQRIVRVATNECESFAAIQAPARLPDMPLRGAALGEELRTLLPHVHAAPVSAPEPVDDALAAALAATSLDDSSEEELGEATMLRRYALQARALLRTLGAWRPVARFAPPLPDAVYENGCGAVLLLDGGLYVPVHRSLLAVRVPRLAAALRGGEARKPPPGVAVRPDVAPGVVGVVLEGMALPAALLLVEYLYTDNLPPVWTANIQMQVAPLSAVLGVDLRAVQPQFKAAAAALELDALHDVLSSPVPRPPRATMDGQLAALFQQCVRPAEDAADGAHAAAGGAPAQPASGAPVPTDTVLHLADAVVPCHSLFLRRSPFLQALYEWRRSCGETGEVHIEMQHLSWAVVSTGLRFLYTDAGLRVFAHTDADKSPDQFIDYVTDVLAFADELLLDKLKLLCSYLLRQRLKPTNVAAMLADANTFYAAQLRDTCMEYATRNMETLLEANLLDALAPRDLACLAAYVQRKQDEHMHRDVARDRVYALMVKHQEYVEQLDIPRPSLNLACLKVPKRIKSPALAPARPPSPEPPPISGASAGDSSLMFAMDDDVDEAAARPAAAASAAASASAAEQDAWQTVGAGPRRGAVRSGGGAPPGEELPARSPPARSPPVRATPSMAIRPPASAPGGPALSPRAPSVRPTPPAGAASSAGWRTGTTPPSGPPVSAGAQEALASMPLAARVSQKERKKQQRQASAEPASGEPPAAWRPSAWGRPAGGRAPPLSSSPHTVTPVVPTRVPSGGHGSMGASRAPSGSWRGTSESPWRNSPSMRASVSPPSAPVETSSTPPTFLQIQEQQAAAMQLEQSRHAVPTSFAQILEEESRQTEQARSERQEAEAFERWFEEESRRVQEQQASREASRSQGNARRGRGRGRRGGGGGGRRQRDPAQARIDD